MLQANTHINAHKFSFFSFFVRTVPGFRMPYPRLLYTLIMLVPFTQVFVVQLSLDNSNLLGKSKKVPVIGSP